jgi:cytochrome oxidase Cu insertion factor (SCO1/SenC/PrrC family)
VGPARPSGAQVSQLSEGSAVKAPLLSWPAGRRAAPNFVLRDQNGRQVSLAAYRSRRVIVTFVDPLCRNLCPLEAQVLNQAVREMPPHQRPVILAVSVDVYGDARSHLLQDVKEWHLVPQWRWAIGRSAQLASVWKNYGVIVKVTTQRIAGVTTINVAHTRGG